MRIVGNDTMKTTCNVGRQRLVLPLAQPPLSRAPSALVFIYNCGEESVILSHSWSVVN